jgi:hypothetical protein
LQGSERAKRRRTGYNPGVLHRHHWTVDEANRALAAVGDVVRRVRDARRALAGAGDAPDAALGAEDGGGWPGREHARATVEATLGIAVLEELGVVVRDIDRGLIDFPALRQGEEVYLCWMLDEPAVRHWHGVQAGFAGRRPLDG